MSNSTDRIEYLGYRYEPTVLEEDDRLDRVIHSIVYIKTGREAGYVDHSPYSEASEEEVHRTIESISEANCEQFANGITPECYKSISKPQAVERAALTRILTLALEAAEREVRLTTPRLARGRKALVIKGRKIKPGTEVELFWVGTQRNPYSHQNEDRAGAILPNGDKVFCSADNLDPIVTAEDQTAYADALEALKEAEKALEINNHADAKAETTPA